VVGKVRRGRRFRARRRFAERTTARRKIMAGQSEPSGRGFAGMDEKKQREIASEGGKAAHEKGTAHEFTPEEARAAGKKGGETVSQDKEHMSEIGKKGGETVSQDKEHMSEIGKKGGESRSGQ
jgi:general stress protein YciG